VFRRKRVLLVTGAVVAAGALVALVALPAAYGIVIGRSGSVTERQTFVHSTDSFATASATYVNVTNADRSVTVAAGTARMVDARFTAESECAGSTGWCSVRIVVVAPNGAVTELDPASGPDFAFATGGGGSAGHGIERTSRLLSAGTYRVQVQARVVGATSLRLDDWALAVEIIRP
jgi:hypothetical protein